MTPHAHSTRTFVHARRAVLLLRGRSRRVDALQRAGQGRCQAGAEGGAGERRARGADRGHLHLLHLHLLHLLHLHLLHLHLHRHG
jgi:hypothetical protein